MASRYVVTGVQLGILRTSSLPEENRHKIIDRILSDQYIGHSNDSVKNDAENIIKSKIFESK